MIVTATEACAIQATRGDGGMLSEYEGILDEGNYPHEVLVTHYDVTGNVKLYSKPTVFRL
jgi:hypothetical protein